MQKKKAKPGKVLPAPRCDCVCAQCDIGRHCAV